MVNLDLTSRQPIYEQIYTSIVKYIAIGVLIPNQQLPTVRAMALELGINPNTVSKAYQMLEQNSYIYSVTGRGSFVSENIDADNTKNLIFTNKLIETIKEGIDLGFGQHQIVDIIKNIYLDKEVKE